MANRTTTLDWQVELENSTWERYKTHSASDVAANDGGIDTAAQRPWLQLKFLLTAMGTVLLAVFVTGVLLWQQAQAGYQQIQAELEETMHIETWSVQTGNKPAVTALIDDNTPAAWRNLVMQQEYVQISPHLPHQITIQDVAFQDDLAMVAIEVTRPGAGTDVAYRTTRFYRRVEDNWQRTAPVRRLLGSVRTLETAHFVFHFRHKDQAAVDAAAARIDAIYTALRRDMGLSDLASYPADKLRIDVVTQISARAYLQVEDNQMTVLSPRLQKIPVAVSNADILSKSIIHQLVRYVTNETQKSELIHPEWTILLNGIQLWQAYAGSEALPHWQTDIISWIYQDAPAIRRGERAPTEADLRLLCRVYSVWGLTLAFVPSPSELCSNPRWRYRLRNMRSAPNSLYKFHMHHYGSDNSYDWTADCLANVAAASLIEYLIETYGRDRIPVLMTGMRRYHTWNELARAVVGVTAHEFEAGWQAYVAKRYGD